MSARLAVNVSRELGVDLEVARGPHGYERVRIERRLPDLPQTLSMDAGEAMRLADAIYEILREAAKRGMF